MVTHRRLVCNVSGKRLNLSHVLITSIALLIVQIVSEISIVYDRIVFAVMHVLLQTRYAL